MPVLQQMRDRSLERARPSRTSSPGSGLQHDACPRDDSKPSQGRIAVRVTMLPKTHLRMLPGRATSAPAPVEHVIHPFVDEPNTEIETACAVSDRVRMTNTSYRSHRTQAAPIMTPARDSTLLSMVDIRGGCGAVASVCGVTNASVQPPA